MAAGLRGFQEHGEAAYPLTPGSVLGLRWFWLPVAALPNPLLPAVQDLPLPVLNGQTGYTYADGELEAACNAPRPARQPGHIIPSPHRIPDDQCGCGFWAYWTEEHASSHGAGGGGLQILGVIEATGRVIHGELGMRAQKAKIAALCPGFQIKLAMAPGLESYKQHGVTWTRDMLPAAEMAAQAQLETRLAAAYPSARVFSARAAMLAEFPPGRGYLS